MSTLTRKNDISTEEKAIYDELYTLSFNQRVTVEAVEKAARIRNMDQAILAELTTKDIKSMIFLLNTELSKRT